MSLFGKIGHFLGGVVNNEVSHMGNLFSSIGKNPGKSLEQFLLGAADPASAKVWGKVLGTKFTPMVSQMGGETQAQFAQSDAQGVDTGPGRIMGRVADTVAAAEAGGYFGSAAGGGSNFFSGLINKGAGAMDGTNTGTGNGMATSSTGGVDYGSLLGSLGSIFGSVQSNSQAAGLQSILNNAYGFNGSRPMYAAELNQFMADPSKMVTSMPEYKFGMDQAVQGTERAMAAQGLTGSGTAAAALDQTANNFAMSEYNSLFEKLYGLSGANLNPGDLFKGQQSIDQQKSNSQGNLFGGLAGLFGGSGSGGSGGGLGSMLSGLFSGGSGGSSGGLGGWLSGLFSSSPEADSGSINLFADAAGG